MTPKNIAEDQEGNLIDGRTNGEGERVLLKRRSPKKKKEFALPSFFFLPPFFLSHSRPLSLQLSRDVDWTLTNDVRVRLTKRALYRMSGVRREEKLYSLFLRRAYPRAYVLSRALKARWALRYRWDLIEGYYPSWNWVKMRGPIPGDTRAYTRAKEDGLSHLHSRTCTSGWYRCTRLVQREIGYVMLCYISRR